MSLLKQITEDLKSYNEFLQSLLAHVEKLEEEIAGEKRIGLTEAGFDPYNKSANVPSAERKENDTLEFKPSESPVAKPQQDPRQAKAGGNARIHLIYNPASGRVEKAIRTSAMARPPAEYMEANADQLMNALKHIERGAPELADKIVSGAVSVWIPRVPGTVGPSSMLQSTGTGGGMNKLELSPEKFAQAKAAADKMSLAQ